MKYIMFEVSTNTTVRKMPIIFPDHLVHEDVAMAVKPVLRKTFKKVEVISAGDCVINALCSGESSTLNLESDPNDSQTITMHDYLHGM